MISKKTAEQIVNYVGLFCDVNTPSKRCRILINRMFRDQDESGKWPISGKFNVTNRAIRRVKEAERRCDVQEAERCCGKMEPLAYALSVEDEIGIIVNDLKPRKKF